MTTIIAPQRTLDQRFAALARANQIRVNRARDKQAIKRGDLSPLEVLADPPDHLHTMRVYDFLRALPKIGAVKAQRCLNRCRISQSKTMLGLSERQREELSAMVEKLVR